MGVLDGWYQFDNDVNAILAALLNEYVVSGGVVTEKGVPDMSVDVAAITYYANGQKVVKAGVTNVAIAAADGTNPRKDIIVGDSAGTLSAVAGTPAAAAPTGNTGPNTYTPVPPDIPANKVLIAEVWVQDNETTILDADITDRRVIVNKMEDAGINVVHSYAELQAVITAIGGTEATIYGAPDTYSVAADYTIPSNFHLIMSRGAIFSIGKYSIRNATYKWTQSPATATEYYLELSGGGDPGINEPPVVYENNVAMTIGTVGSLAAGEWAWGDNGGEVGFNTVYVRLTVGGDPDLQAVDWVEAGWRLTISGTFEGDLSQHFSGAGCVTFEAVKEVYPQWWGAVGDGVADDGPAIQAASVAFYRVFFAFPLDFYNVEAKIIPPSGRHFLGGAGGVSSYVKIRNTSAGANQHCFELVGKDRITFEKLDIQGGSAVSSDGIFVQTVVGPPVQSAKWVTLRDVRLHSCGRDGYHSVGAILTKMDNVEARDNVNIGVMLDGIGGGPSSTALSLYDVYAYNNGSHGFYLGTAGAVTLQDAILVRCFAEDNGGHGFWVGGSRLDLTKCVAESNDLDGFYDVRIGHGTYNTCFAIANAGQGFNINAGASGTYIECEATQNVGNQWDIDVATVGQILINPAGTVVDNNGTNAQIFGSGLRRGKANFGNESINIRQYVNISTPPTDAELDALYGTPAALGRGFIGTIDNDPAGGVYIVFTTNDRWWWAQATQAV